MNSLENIRHVSFYGGETGFVEFGTARAGFLDEEYYFPATRDVEFRIDGTENL